MVSLSVIPIRIYNFLIYFSSSIIYFSIKWLFSKFSAIFLIRELLYVSVYTSCMYVCTLWGFKQLLSKKYNTVCETKSFKYFEYIFSPLLSKRLKRLRWDSLKLLLLIFLWPFMNLSTKPSSSSEVDNY